MSRQKIISNDSEKVPSYVSVYNKIYADIMEGVYKNGELLPGETTLARNCGVSRNTLRQALTILTEDGLIKKLQGKGNVVILNKKPTVETNRSYFNPMTEYAIEEVAQIDVNYNFAPPTNVACEKLGLSPYNMLIASNNLYYIREKAIGHSFMQIPLDCAKNLAVDIRDRDEVANLLNKLIFESASSAHVVMRVVEAHDNIRHFLDVEKGTPLIYLEELLYDSENTPICRCKFYFIPEWYDLRFWI